MAPQGTDFLIELERPADMFAPPDVDPLAGRFETSSGMNRLLVLAGRHKRRALEHGSIMLSLPAAQMTPDLADRIRTGIKGYCAERIADIDLRLEHLSRDGQQALWLALIFLAFCTGLASIIGNMPAIPPFLRRVLAEGLNIAGWVALWRPIELLLYDAMPFRIERRILAAIATWPVSLVGR